jgi:hypothetical protein
MNEDEFNRKFGSAKSDWAWAKTVRYCRDGATHITGTDGTKYRISPDGTCTVKRRGSQEWVHGSLPKDGE